MSPAAEAALVAFVERLKLIPPARPDLGRGQVEVVPGGAIFTTIAVRPPLMVTDPMLELLAAVMPSGARMVVTS